MKLHYIGVCLGVDTSSCAPTTNDTWRPQIIRNESSPSHELVSEKELSSYSRFTKNNYGVCDTIPSILPLASVEYAPRKYIHIDWTKGIYDDVRQDCGGEDEAWS